MDVEPGDVLFGKLRPYLAKVLLAPSAAYASTELLCLRPRPGVDPRWLFYGMLSRPVIDWAVATSEGTKMPRTSWWHLGKLALHVPSETEQRAIAEFLDAETARIDALIATKRLLIASLRERRAVATIAGVRGDLTSASAPRVEVTLPWLTTYPAHWRTAKLTLVAQLGSGHTPSRDHAEWWEDCTIPWVTTGEVAQMRDDRIEHLTETRELISVLGVANSSATIHPAGTVMLSRTASAGFSAIMGVNMTTSQDFVTWTCGSLLESRYLLLCLRGMRQDLLDRLAQGSTHKTIYMPDIESIRIPLPPVHEQGMIVRETWGRLRPIDDAVDRLNRQIGLLQEHRHALITAAVAGELDVPGAAA